ncbi:hypothetical protein FHX37_4553 [Haloactinospora alba]|uniref:Uncharacterized protein n=1 Tax=Haloactinospora alba TaxID=405555 RepID=A0A543N7M3_9ACTN|nr:hypothetical protein FHX37_4553 [Haloactinospora alba]
MWGGAGRGRGAFALSPVNAALPELVGTTSVSGTVVGRRGRFVERKGSRVSFRVISPRNFEVFSLRLPRSVLWVRILLFVLGGFWAAMAVASLLMLGLDAYALGYAVMELLPAAFLITLASVIRKNGVVVFWLVLVSMTLYLLITLVLVLGGNAVTQLLLPAMILILLLRSSSRAFFLQR